MELTAGVKTIRSVKLGGTKMNTDMTSNDHHRLSPAQVRLALAVAMGIFFASAAAIPAMGTLLRQISRLLLP